MKNIFWRYGRKIKKWDDRLLMRSVIFCICVCMAVSAVFVARADYGLSVPETPLASRIAAVVLFGMMLCVCVVFAAYRQPGIREGIKNREALAHMIIDNGWYETDLKTNSRGDQNITYMPRLYFWRRHSITYFPRLYYKRRKGKIYLTVKINMSRYQEQLKNLESKVETGLDCELIDKEYKGRWMHYVFVVDVPSHRIKAEEMTAEKGHIQFMDYILWDYSYNPHALIVGDTGSGKTWFLLSIIEALLKSGAGLRIIDAKNASLAGLSMVLPDVHYDVEGIGDCLVRFYEDMMARMAEMKEKLGRNIQGDYRDCGMKPEFLIFDEYVAYLEMLGKKEWEEAVSVVKKIALLGRQAGFFLILTCQRPDAKYLPDGVRMQFGLRIALGTMDANGYTMIFGSTEKSFVKKNEKGRGYVSLWNGVITEFYSPFVSPSHDFMENISAAYIPGETQAPPCQSQPAGAQRTDGGAPPAYGV